MNTIAATSVAALQFPAVANIPAMSIPVSKKMQKLDPFNTSPNSSPQSQSPLLRYKSMASAYSPPRDGMKYSPQRPASFGQLDGSPRGSPSSSPKTRPSSIDTSVGRLNLDKLATKATASSISNPRPQPRLKSILKYKSSETASPLTPGKSKIHFNVTMEHICHFSKNDFPSEIRDSPRTTIDDSGDVDAITASAAWEAMCPPVTEAWTVLSSNHSGIAKISISDAILLESSRVQGDTLIGAILVRNYAFHKTVKVRYTIDNWVNSMDIVGEYCNSIKNMSNDPYGMDRFTFTIDLPELFAGLDPKEPLTICYALQYSVASRTYWDNNNGANYEITIVNNLDGTTNTAQESKPWWETSVPRPRQRSKRSGLKKSISSSALESRNVAIASPFNNLSSNFSENANSRVEDSFAFRSSAQNRTHFQVVRADNSNYRSLESPLGTSPNLGSSFYESNFRLPDEDRMSSSTFADKSVRLIKPYGDDFYMSSPPSSFSRS